MATSWIMMSLKVGRNLLRMNKSKNQDNCKHCKNSVKTIKFSESELESYLEAVDYRSDLEPSARSTLTRDLVVEALAYYNKCGQFLF
jgi:hypothetical protein